MFVPQYTLQLRQLSGTEEGGKPRVLVVQIRTGKVHPPTF